MLARVLLYDVCVFRRLFPDETREKIRENIFQTFDQSSFCHL